MRRQGKTIKIILHYTNDGSSNLGVYIILSKIVLKYVGEQTEKNYNKLSRAGLVVPEWSPVKTEIKGCKGMIENELKQLEQTEDLEGKDKQNSK